MLSVLGHLGVWAGLYALAAFICIFQLAGLPHSGPLPPWEAMVCVLLTATAVYSVDRVKLLSAWLDPADSAAQPERYRFLIRRAGGVRLFALSLLVAAALVGFRMHPVAPLLVFVAAASTVAYAPTPRGTVARVKDRLWLKNAYVAIGMAGFSAFIAVLASHAGTPVEVLKAAWDARIALGLAFLAVAIRVFLDAALCDIDDEPTDREFFTETFATRLGSPRVWNWAGIGRLVVAFGLLFATPLPIRPRVAWSMAMVMGMFALRWRHPTRIRDTVDFRFFPEAVFVTLVLMLSANPAS